MTAGVLVSQGLLDLGRPVESYLPGVAASGYAGASVRDLLDMRSGIAFSEDYLDPLAEVRVMEQVIGWAPRTVPGRMTSWPAYT
jgi:CubicO group peptidase (beta-lactamase class C family)